MKKGQNFNELETLTVDSRTKDQEKKRPRFTMHSFRNIYRGVKIPWGRYILAILLTMGFSILTGSATGISAKIASGDFSDPGLIIQYVVVSILGLGTMVAGIVLDFANYRLNTRVKSKLWRKILRLPMEYFDRVSPTRIISRVTVDTDAALVPFTVAGTVVTVFAMILGVLLSAFGVFDTPMAKWIYIGIVVMVVLVISCMILMVYVGYISASRLSSLTSFLSERLANFKLIKASGSEKEELGKVHQLIFNRMEADMYGLYANIVNYLSFSSILFFAYLGCFLLGWQYYEQGLITSGQTIIQVNAFMVSLSGLVTFIGMIVINLGTGAGSATVFARIFDEKEEDVSTGKEMPAGPRDIYLRNVNFSYNQERLALKNLNCRIEKGKVTAIVGANGSGKSTLVKILDRLYSSSEGEIFLGDEKMEDISLSSWRNRTAIVSQNASLFSGSIRSNICYGIENVTEEELAAVCKMSGVEEIIAAHEEGLDYEVGIGGCKLSGGEQQRIAIARAMIKNPDYLILDEATANLDTRTGKEVQKSINSLMKGRTVITIAHNYETIRQADTIMVLSEGKIIANGTHEELIESCDFYKQLYAAGFEV